MSKINAFSFTVDSAPGAYGFADAVRLTGDSWDPVYWQPYTPFVFNYTDNNIEPRFPLSGGWLCVDALSSAEIFVVFESADKVVISDPVFLAFGMTLVTDAAYMRVVAVRRAGHVRVVHGSQGAPLIPAGISAAPTESHSVELKYASCMTWTAYQAPTGNAADGTVRVGPVEMGISGNHSGPVLLSVNATGLVAGNFEFLQYGHVYMAQDPDLIGTVTGGIFVREFTNLYTNVLSGVLAAAGNSQQLTAWQFPAVYYKLTAAGIAAGAGLVIPDRRFQCKVGRFYNRAQTPFAVA